MIDGHERVTTVRSGRLGIRSHGPGREAVWGNEEAEEPR